MKFKDKATISLCISDFLRAFVGYSIELFMLAFESQSHKICMSFGFVVPFFSYTAIFQLTQLLLHRWRDIKRCTWRMELGTPSTKSYFGIAFCWILALILSGMPLVKLGVYELQSGVVRCSVIWKSASIYGILYVIVLFIFAFVIPLILIVASFVGTQLLLRKHRVVALTQLEADPASAIIQMKLRAEKRNASMFFTMTFLFLLAWTPYAVTSFIAAFAGQVTVPKIVNTIATIPAKASTMQNPLIMACYDRDFRAFLKRLIKFEAETGNGLHPQQAIPLQQIQS